MAILKETATRKRVFGLQSEINSSWTSPFSPTTSLWLSNRSEISQHFEKKQRYTQKPMNGFKWEPNDSLSQPFSPGCEVRTPLPPAWREHSSRGLSTPPNVQHSREQYESVKQELMQRSSWYSKSNYPEALAEEALDIVRRPSNGLNHTLRPYRNRFVSAQRELEDYKRVVSTVNRSLPITSNGMHTVNSSVESMKLRGSNLQQGPRNLYNMQEGVAEESQWGGSHSSNGVHSRNSFARTVFLEAQSPKDIVPAPSVQPIAASSHHEDAQAPKDDDQNVTWKTLYDNARDPEKNKQIESNDREIEALEQQWSRLRVSREEGERSRQKEREASKKEKVIEALIPLSDDAEQAVENALYYGNRNDVLAFHAETNIEVTRAIMQCLEPGAWLNDEVINVYMQLLKERETRSPDKFLKCHFFNTFFYNKLFKDKRNYDYKSVRRWTTQKKIGYSLADCDKILVPIHQDIHWCLAVINIKDQKFEYLDSLQGRDENVLRVLAKYLVDEAKDKNNRILDVSQWESVFPQDIPEQLNGCDCGMFMLKYADFHSRGDTLPFSQAHMEYFRKRTVFEILQKKAS